MNKKSSGTAKAEAKVVACMLSIMLVVTGIVPGFAAESKASKQNGKKPAASKVISKGTDKKKAESKPKVSKDKGGVKKNKIKNKRDQVLELNESGNVRVKRNPVTGDISVKATNRWGDMNIDRGKWINMLKAFRGTYDPEKGLLDWDEVDMNLAGNLSFETYGICLPSDCSYFFNRYSGQIKNCAYLDTSKVRDMSCMFAGASNKSLDISSWDVSKVCSMDQMFARSAIGRLDLSRWKLGVLENENKIGRAHV